MSLINIIITFINRYSGRTQHQAQLSTKLRREQKNDTSPESGAESSTLPRNYHHQNPSYHPPRSANLNNRSQLPTSVSGRPNSQHADMIQTSPDMHQPDESFGPADSSNIYPESMASNITQPPPQSNSMTAISDIPIAEITGNKRHTMYNTQPAQLAVVTAPPSKDPPSNLPTSSLPKDDSNASYKLESVSKKSSRSNEAKGTMYALLSETTMASKKTSYSEKVAVVTKESTFAKDGHEEENGTENGTDNGTENGKSHENGDGNRLLEPTSTAMVSVDGEEDDIVQGEVVSSQIITSR